MLKEVILCVMVMASVASAITVQGINIDFVTIGNPGNSGDTRTGDYPNQASPYGCGAIDYTYHISKYEITNAQWNDFTLAAGAPIGSDGLENAYDESSYWTGEQQPTNNVSWYEAAQFCNYLTSGDKSRGAYLFNGNNANPGDFLGINRDLAISTYGTVYVIPTESEWYKAAYYTGNGYSTYANGTDVAPIADDDTNYDQAYPYDGPWNVGTGTIEQNGTFDMMGNVLEWNETLINSLRGYRGGSFFDPNLGISSSFRNFYYSAGPYLEADALGFRVASVPEPGGLVMLSLGGLILLRRRLS